MESSQVDFLASQVPSSQMGPPKNSTSLVYDQIVLFNWSKDELHPFKVYPRSDFRDEEIRDEWLKYQMRPKSRIRKLKSISKLPNQNLSMFAKVQSRKCETFFVCVCLLSLLFS